MWESRLKLKDGRTLGVAEYGDSKGAPLFLFHGTPGSRLWFLEDDPVATSLRIRLIAPERPGYGVSNFKKLSYLEWADDVVELADALGVGQFGIAAGSGGGPYAAACAYKFPQRVAAGVLISSLAPLEAPGARRGMRLRARAGLRLARWMRWRPARWSLASGARNIAKDPGRFIDRMGKKLCAPDRQILSQEAIRAKIVRQVREAYRSGVDAHLHEFELAGRPWGFDLRQIRVPFQLWHGEEDTLVPLGMGIYLAALIPGCSGRFLPDAGHLLAEDPRRWEEILRALIS